MNSSDQEDRLMRIRRGGCDIEGRWRLAGDEVVVECCFGADHARFDGAPPARVAELLLARLAFAAMGGKLEPLMN
jgi:hypothetical protein